MSDLIAELNATLEDTQSAALDAEQAATQMEQKRDATLSELGPQLAQKVRAFVRRVNESNELADEISLFLLTARSVCFRTVTSKHPDFEERSMGEKKVYVPDWDGRSQEYRGWFARHFYSIVSENLVDEIDQEDLAKLAKGEDGQPLPEAVVLAAPTGKTIKRAVEYRVEENRPNFVREMRPETWEDELQHLGLKLTSKTEDQRNKRRNAGTTSDSGIPAQTVQTENRLKSAVKSVKILNKDGEALDAAEQDVAGLVNIAAWLVMHAKALDEAMTLEVIDAFPKAELRKVSAYTGSALAAMDSLSKRLPD